MSLQWTVVALVLYGEVGFLLLLLLPWIRPSVWQSIFKSNFVRGLEAYSHIFVYGFATILVLLFLDAIREVRKYSSVETMVPEENVRMEAGADAMMHMRLFRAQRNLYISGFALFLWMVIKRTISLKAREAQLEASAEAAMKQAQSASNVASSLMNSRTKEASANEKESRQDEDANATNALKETIAKLRKELEIAVVDRDTMKKQSDSLKREYDRLLEEFSGRETSGGDKKDD